MRKLPYHEGTWFAVPLEKGGYAVGVVARVGRRGILLGYFFGPCRDAVPALTEVEGLRTNEASFVGKFSHLGLVRAEWPVIGKSDAWDRRRWPIPAFGSIVPLLETGVKVEYTEEDLARPVRETPIPKEEARALPRDGLYGSGAVEGVLTDLLCKSK